MRIFLTGATGFLGSYIAREALNRRHDVAVLIRTHANLWRISDIIENLKVIYGTLEEQQAWQQQIHNFAPDAIIHAAWHGVENKSHSSDDQLSNIPALKFLLALATACGCKKFIGIGSQAEYGLHDGIIHETTITAPVTTYGQTKLAAFDISHKHCQTHCIQFSWLRIFTIYGPTDNPYWLIPYLVTTLLSGTSPQLTKCEQRWGFLYVTDAANAIMDVLESPNAQGTYNLGSNEIYQLRYVAETLRNMVNPNLQLEIGKVPYKPNQIMHLEANIESLKTSVGWQPKVSLYDGLQKTVEWYKSNNCPVN